MAPRTTTQLSSAMILNSRKDEVLTKAIEVVNKFSNDSRRDVDSGMNAILEYLGVDPMNRNQEKEFVSMILSKQRIFSK